MSPLKVRAAAPATWVTLGRLLTDSLAWWPGRWGHYAAAVGMVSLGQGGMAWATAVLVQKLVNPAPAGASRAAAVGLAAATLKALASWKLAREEVTLSRLLGDELRDRAIGAILVGQRGQGVFPVLAAVREVERAAVVGGLGAVRAGGALVPLAVVGATLVTGTALLQASAIAALGVLLGRTRRRLAADEVTALSAGARLDQELEAVVRHADLWRVAGSGAAVRRWLRGLGQQAREALARAHGRRAALSGLNEALAAGLVVALLAASEAGWWQGGPALLPLVAVITLSYRPLRDWSDARAARQGGEAALAVLRPWLGASASPDGPASPRPGAAADERSPAAAPTASERPAADPGPGSRRPAWPLATLEATDFGASRHPARWTFRLEPGALGVLCGPNASGKTTLLRALLGLEPSSGRLRYGEVELAGRGAGPGERPLGWSPQDTPVLSTTLGGNVELAGAGSLEAARRWLGDGWGRELEGQTLGEHGRALSGGERAWLSVARACATGAPVLLLDEPTASLDAEAERRLVGLVASLRSLHTVVVVTHRPALWPADAVRLEPSPS